MDIDYVRWSPDLEVLQPDEARLTLTTLMTRLILDHADGADRQRKEAGHDA